MTFPSRKKRTSRTLSIEGFSGGLNTAAPDTLCPGQLREAVNVWWRGGKLRTRPGFYTKRTLTNTVYDTTSSKWELVPFGEAAGDVRGTRVVSMHTVEDSSQGPVREIRTGVCRADGTITLQSTPLPGTYSTDGPCPVTVVDYAAGDGDGSLVFTRDGHIYRPPADESGTYTDLLPQAYVPLLLRDGRGVCEAEADEIPLKGTLAEGKNLLSEAFRAHFSTDGKADIFRLPLQNLDAAPVEIELTLGDTAYAFTIPSSADTSGTINDIAFSIDRVSGLLRCREPSTGAHKALPLGLPNNLRVLAYKTEAGAVDHVCGMRFGVWFGGEGEGEQGGARLFLSGHPDYPNEVRWSAPDNPLYFPEHNYGRAGDTGSAVTAFGRQGDRLILFKEHELYALSGTAGRVGADPETGMPAPESAVRFPVEPVHAGVGCDLPRTIRLCGNRLVWATSAKRVYMLVSASAYNDTAVRELSGSVADELQGYGSSYWEAAQAATYDGHYLLLLGYALYLFCYESAAFERYVYVYDDAAAQKKLAWYCWLVPDTIGVIPELLVSDGEGCALFASQSGRLLIGYLPQGTQDITVSETLPLVYTAQEIPVSVETGLLGGDDLGRRQTVERVFLDVTALTDAPVVVTYVTPQGSLKDTLTPVRGEQETVCLSPQLSGVTRIGLRIRSTGALVVGAMSVHLR